jgi:phosphoglycerate dehydrogenase-like enzyme
MPMLTVTVIGNADDPSFKPLDRLPKDIHLTVTDNLETLKERVPESDVIVIGVFSGGLWAKVVPLATKARWIHAMGTGVEKLLTPETVAHLGTMTNGRGVFRRPLGDWTVAMMLHFAFDIPRVTRQQREQRWEPFTAPGIEGRTLGIIGYGGIGSAAAERAKPFGVKILALRRRPELSASDPVVDQFYAPAQINEMISASDYLLVATPLTKDTHELVGPEQIGAMKPTAVLINVGRGQVIHEASLVQALESGTIRGAALDVVQQEPLPAPHPFYTLPNVVLSPHTADHVEGFLIPATESFVENFERFRKGEPLENVVDKHAGY